jgi:alpha-tubulin suppressor-like RCC1 family protein
MFGSRNFLFAKSAAAAPVASGKLFTWGDNIGGQLGLGNITDYSSPKQVGALTNWSQVATTGYHTLAINTTGQLWSWGYNNKGQLGQGNTTNCSSPIQVGALTNWKQPSVSGYSGNSSFCIKTDGTLWAWGNNANYQLGQGNMTNRSSPVQIGSNTNWAVIKSSPSASTFCLATTTDGKLFAWGDGFSGKLGLGNQNSRSFPVQVGALTTWLNPATGQGFSVCTKTDGTLWTWGNGNQGRLGLSNTTSYSSPKQVGSDTNWLTPAAGGYTAMCVKTDGTLWSWGYAGFGQLGISVGYTTNRSSPVQVGALTNWSKPIMGAEMAGCLKTDGTLWMWGRNVEGQLGQGNTTNRSSPVQVGSLTTWTVPSAGFANTACIQT